MKLYFFLILLYSTNILFASDLLDPKEKSQYENGCGTGWNSYLVPNYIPLANCILEAACNAHDVCYSKCLIKENQDNPLCKYKQCLKSGRKEKKCGSPDYMDIRKQAMDRKTMCDNNFYGQIINDNQNKPICKNFARLYKFAVVHFGKDAFSGMGISGGVTEEQKNGNHIALNNLLTRWSENRIQSYLSDVESGKLTINWEKPLIFNESSGLIEK
jgi:hypothetical protein